jgi:hypothetical protein
MRRLILVVAAGCGFKAPVPYRADGGPPPDGSIRADGSIRTADGSTTRDGASFDVIRADAPTPADAGPTDAAWGHDFATATALTVSTPVAATLSDLFVPDLYSFTGQAGHHLMITVTAQSGTDDQTVIDTVVSLFKSDQSLLASDDDAWGPRIDSDSRLLTELPASGVYYVRVETCNNYAASHAGISCWGPAGITKLDYTLTVTDLTVAGGEIIGSQLATRTIVYPTTATTGVYGHAIVGGDLTASTDIHHFSFTAPADTRQDPESRTRASFYVQPYGAVNGDGTAINVMLTVTDSAGHVLGAIDQQYFRNGDDPTSGPPVLSIPLDDQFGSEINTPLSLTLTLSGSTAITAGKSFYFIDAHEGSPDPGAYDPEGPTGSGANDTLATAQQLSLNGIMFAVVGNISSPTDTDWFRMNLPGTSFLTVACQVSRIGSGLIGFHAQLFNSSGTTKIADLQESLPASQDLTKSASSASGTVYLEVTATGQDSTVKGSYYRCTVLAP